MTRIHTLSLTIIAALIAVVGVITYMYTRPQAHVSLIVATTTSLYDTGLLDHIEDVYLQKYDVKLYFISVGTGLALKHAERGDADVVLVHAPVKEAEFLMKGYGADRKIIAYNFFAIVGPSEDPAEIKNMSPIRAISKIVAAGRAGVATWVSRGDESGTHVKEKLLWKAAGFDPSELRKEKWYIESGTGMGKTLMIANEKEAYTLADMGTYLRYRAKGLMKLVPLVTKGRELLNVYSVIAVNPERHPNVNFGGAIQFIKFLVSDEGQRIIEDYRIGSQPLFRPAVKLLRENSNSKMALWIREYAFINGTECPPKYWMGHNELYSST